jgi:hypothetical protein
MATLLQIAQGIETDYCGDTANSVQALRPQMGQPLSAGNMPFFKEVGAVADFLLMGIVRGYLLVKAQTGAAGDISVLQIDCVKKEDNTLCIVTTEGRKVLDDYKKYYRPFDSENDNLWTHVLNYFRTTRSLRFVVKIDIYVGTPVYGRVNGLRFIGDGVTDPQSVNEYWAFEATYPWGTPGNIKSWKY